jgi:hypothetical protein
MRDNKIKYQRLLKALVVWVVLTAINGCGKGDAYILVPQQWDDVEFVVEIRPGAPRVGMNEFVVIATHSSGVPGYQYVLSIKMNSDERWVQMIQDGHSGVYRRAIAVKDPANGILNVQIRYQKDKDKNTNLDFPLSRHVK